MLKKGDAGRTGKENDWRGPGANDARDKLGAGISNGHDGHQAANFGHVKVQVGVLDHLWGSV